MSPRIAVAGFLHESNAFAAGVTPFSAFEQPGGWPRATAGAALIEDLSGSSVPAAGALEALRQAGAAILPLAWFMANPAGPVADEAYARIADAITDRLIAAGPVDGVYLDLHGAAITESLEDAEGDLLARVRRVVGPEVPVVASLDFHANVSPLMLKESDGLIAFRTYPHVDMAETGARAARFLLSLVAAGGKLAKAMRQPPCLISIVWQSTLMPPMAGLIAAMERLEAELGVTMSLLAGFPHADVHDGGPAILAYGDRAEEAAETLSRQFEAALPDFAGALHSPENAIAAARAAPGRGPALLIDTQDNPGGGGFGDTTGVLAALIAAKALNACLCLIADPDAAAAAHAAGEGALIRLALGGRSDGVPFRADWRVARLGDGRFTGEGPLTAGNRVDLGPMALLAHEGVSVVVVSRKMQAHDPAILRHLGVDPAGLDLLALKSSVHFRAAFGPMARAIYVVVAPGPVAADITTLPFRRLRSGVALSPGGPIFPGTARATP